MSPLQMSGCEAQQPEALGSDVELVGSQSVSDLNGGGPAARTLSLRDLQQQEYIMCDTDSILSALDSRLHRQSRLQAVPL
ncbi:hypothetical protein EYF80_067016 [Liparis tanakae]|uniref:Uncharacterized protein n=1 Tax=Liparis tanakae TaxID=230148 RepID=A0A4Z2E2B1_9TELE|nr:hypothetical protein EYF80_067016 [Liparis tanakae]